jgi:urease accessory protein
VSAASSTAPNLPPPSGPCVEGRGLRGHLDILCAADSSGKSILRHQSFRAPIHLSKPHWDEGALVLNVVNPTAGLLADDRITMRARVAPGARLLLTSPSASRAHRMRDGHAAVNQHFSVAASGSLESWPELFIPQAGTRYHQRTTLEVEPGGELLFFESLAPGRVAFGESFEYALLDWATELRCGDTLIARERYRLAPEEESVRALRRQFEHAYYASALIVSPRLTAESPCWQAIHRMQAQGLWVGCGALAQAGWTVKVLAEGSVLLRRALAEIRAAVYQDLGRAMPSLRRAG